MAAILSRPQYVKGYDDDSKNVNLEHILMSPSSEIALRWIPQNRTDDKSKSVQSGDTNPLPKAMLNTLYVATRRHQWLTS